MLTISAVGVFADIVENVIMSDQLPPSDECCIFATNEDTETPDTNCKHATDPEAELAD